MRFKSAACNKTNLFIIYIIISFLFGRKLYVANNKCLAESKTAITVMSACSNEL